MDYSYQEYVGDGSTKAWTFSLTGPDQGYISKDDLVVTVGGSEVSFTLISADSFELTEAPASGVEVMIRRALDAKYPYADFQGGAAFDKFTINRSFQYLLYLIQQILDGFFADGAKIRGAVTFMKDVWVHGKLKVDGAITGFKSDPRDPEGAVSFEKGDERYVNKTGDEMQGALRVRVPQFDEEPARKGQLDTETRARVAADAAEASARQKADARIQAQLTNQVPLEGSAFSPISWHPQVIETSVDIPEGVNAWSFGPKVTIASGQRVRVGAGSHWTVANGSEVPSTIE